LGFDFDGEIRTAKLAQLATDTILGPSGCGFVLFVQFQDFFRAELDTNAASFAPIPVDMVFL
jgi:hypothetical protein